MSMTDPIADMLTRIRNAQMAKHDYALIPMSRIKERVAEILSEEGYLGEIEVQGEGIHRQIKVALRYVDGQQPLVEKLQRLSKPGRRQYVKSNEIPRPLGGLGLVILSTSKGVMSGRSARKQRLGGELLCSVY